MKKRLRLFYSGRVQGVGFRYTVEEIARKNKVFGWVKNLSDGRVEITAESDEEALNGFISQVKEHFFRYIEDVEMEWLPATGEFSDFEIVF